MPTSCCAYNCSERSVSGGPVAFHRFPTKDEMLFRAWCVALRRKDFHPTWSSRVCSKHFTKDSYEPGFKYRKLKRDAVPTIFNFGKKTRKKYRKRKSLKNSTKNESYKSYSNDNEDYLSDQDSIAGSDMADTFEEIPKTVEIIRIKRDVSSEDSEMECHQAQSRTSEDSVVNATEDSMTFDKLYEVNSLPSDQLRNMQNENEVLRQTILQLNKKMEEFKCLIDIFPSQSLIRESYLSDNVSNDSSKMYTSEEKSVEIIKLKRDNSSERREMECHHERLQTPQDSADKTAEDSKSFDKLDKVRLTHNQINNLLNENEVLRKTIQDLNKNIRRCKCLTDALRSHDLKRKRKKL